MNAIREARRSTRPWRWCCALVALGIAGCGTGAYEERLEESVKARRAEINEAERAAKLPTPAPDAAAQPGAPAAPQPGVPAAPQPGAPPAPAPPAAAPAASS